MNTEESYRQGEIDTGYNEEFRRQFGREPTAKDIEKISEKIPYSLFDEEGEDSGQRNGFDRTIGRIREANRTTRQKVLEAIIAYAKERKKEEQAKTERKTRIDRLFWKFANRFITSVLICGAIGMGTGGFIGLYQANNSQEAQRIKREYEEKEGKLQEKFFGPLEELASSNFTSELTPEVRKLYAESKLNLGEEVLGSERVIYNQDLGKVGIKASILTEKQRREADDNYLLISKTDTKGGIIELNSYLYDGRNPGNLEYILKYSEPHKTISFIGNEVRVTNHKSGETKKLSKDGKVDYRGNEGKELYVQHAKKIFGQFKTLYSRGPNIPGTQSPKQINVEK